MVGTNRAGSGRLQWPKLSINGPASKSLGSPEVIKKKPMRIQRAASTKGLGRVARLKVRVMCGTSFHAGPTGHILFAYTVSNASIELTV